MPALLARVSGIAFACLFATRVEAASLRVAPTTLDLLMPDSAATLNLRNEDSRPINVQIRVFRWTQSGGADRLEPTTDVVASPPSQTLGPNADYVVRVVRVSKEPVVGEESYRVVVDELPDPARRRPGIVNLVLRYSVPVFFRGPDARPGQVSWTVGRSGNALAVTAKNAGQQRLKIADLKLIDGAGKSVTLGKGLVGYVLGNATMQWSFPAHGTSLSSHAVTLSAQSDAGQINATAAVQAGR
ncbi:fimbrial chaperone protein [Bradyrhizobium japonicum]|jgi:fimbrial chaperone protein|uniref:Fimbrial chaperone protein n=1 Tax=Bradyrhizobium elkanii TaxID=29448 RepID=A0ABV4F7V7_BRAEL|nr:molecular chaperone [Bradyrhizobium elkanii]MBP2433631.1 fimbrial chaperone protein [Bradyrhizobium elkanii]MCP1732983.1 fimbrial chaperone protein [Bradyrhizobium elkanii]MCP1750562.1 fimbrial chaperone protein [Bradyrhizobium elkanii]MCP1976336.1 fimbrial chaperone protein [Bradyrhizobium elkanii]MCS3568321.1 fimbrial chaperone protein [Bradyrhizobium elkanii]